jgi:2-keto-3-deoxy-L-rhamnonate aldolase RhmA
MQTNSMKLALARGETQIGVWINMVRNPAILRLMKSAGLDFARFDMEHASPSIETLSNMALLARAMDFTITVRPPAGNREWITRLLDAGVWSLHVPQVDTPEIAEQVVKASLYAPDGLRGMAGIGNHTDYETGPMGETQRFLNEQIHLAIMFESQQSFDHIDEILSVEGIDAVTLGPSDLAQELGVFGTSDQAKVIDDYRTRLIEAAGRHGKDVSMLVGSIEQGERWIRAGAKIICYSSEVDILRRGIMEAADRLHAVR